MHKIAKFEKVSICEIPITLPRRATDGSAGYDFFAPWSFSLNPGQEILIPTWVKCKIDPGWFLMIVPRSSLGFKYYARLANTCGIIDSDYYNNESNEGHIMIKIRNESDVRMNVDTGKGIAQGIFLPYGVTIDDETLDSRSGGIGSTDR